MTVSTTHFVNSLRVRPEIIRLANEQAPLVWTVRVQAAEVWDAVRIEATPGTRNAQHIGGHIKATGLAVDHRQGPLQLSLQQPHQLQPHVLGNLL